MKVIAPLLAALLLVAASVVFAAGTKQTPTPKTMSLACAKKDSGKLQYVSTAGDCPSSRGKLVHFPQDRPVKACELDQPNTGTRRKALPPPAHPHNVKGMLFKVAFLSQCHGPKYPNSHGVILPKAYAMKLCAGKRHGTVREVAAFTACNSLEFPVVLAKRPNAPPKANDQKVDVNEDTAKSITLTGSDPDGDSLTFSLTSSPSHGALSGTAPNLTYTPALNYTGPDSFKFKVSDGHGHSSTGNVTITVHPVNDAPVVATSAGSTAYTEQAAGVVIDSGLTVSDPDSANLTGATVTIADNFQSGDSLDFVDELGITGSYNTGTGVLTLTGTTTVANYQQALRDVKFSSSQDDPQTAKTIEFTASDGTATGAPASKGINVTPVNDAPTLSTTAANLAYTEGDGAVAIDGGLTLTDPDSAQMQGATVQITGNFASADDELSFTNTPNITGVYNDSTGTLTLTGNDTVTNYQTALRSVKFENVNQNPSGSKTVSFQATDASGAASNTATRTIDLTGANTAPTVTTTAGSTSYAEGDPGATIDSGLTVTDPDDTNIESAEVKVSAGFQAGDDLIFVNTPNISGVYNTGTGVLTMTGTDTVANYQAALRSIQFRTTNDNPSSSKTVSFKVNDGDVDSNVATKGISVTPVNDAPSLATSSGSASFTENGSAAAVDPNVALDDPDSTNLSGAKVSITANFSSADGDTLNFTNTPNITGAYNSSTGVLTLSGTDTLANYAAALRSVTFSNTSDNPSTATRTVSFQVTDDGALPSNTDTRDVTVATANDAPVVTTSSGSTSYTEGDPATTIDGSLTVTDADDANIESAEVTISTGFQSGDDLIFVNTPNISGVYNTGTGVLTMTGTDTVANYQAALRSIQYRHTGDNPGSSKTVSFKVNDGDVDSSTAFKGINITGVNDAPTLNTTATNLAYTEGDGAVAIDGGLTVDDPDSTQIQGATVQITGNFVSADDELAFTNTANITGVYNDSTGVLTLSGTDTVANYQAALRSVTYENVNQNPSGSKTLSFQATDSSAAASNVATRTVDLTGANDAPTVTTSSGSTPYSEGDPATTIDGSLTVTDPDDTNLEGGQVRISSGFQSGDDLVFVNQNGISGVYNTGTGVLTLTGTSSVANYQTALRSIEYQTTNDNPSSPKTVEFKLNDGDVDSNAATKNVSVTPVNDAPTVNTTATNLAYTEGDGPVAADSGFTASDPDSTNLSGATVSISSNFVSADDELAFTNTANITGVYNDSTGVLTLSGTDTVANYQAAIRSVTYENVNQNPSGTKTLSFQATDDGALASNTATRDVDLTGVNDAPVVTTSSGSTPYTEGDPATTIDGSLTVTDPDDTNLEGGQVRISSGFQSGDDLVFVNQNGISGVYNTGTGVLTLTGTSSVANYQTALRSIEYQTTNDNPSSPKTVEFKLNDGDVDSNAATKNIAITGVNTAPTATTSATALSYTEGDGPVAADSGFTASDPDSTNLSGATVSISANFVSADDELAFTNTANITGAYNDSTGVLTLSGTDTVANYQAAIRSVTYENVNQNPSGSKTLSFQVTDDGALPSNTATRTVNLTAVNDAPVVTTTSGDTAYTEGDPATTIDSGVTVTDVDDTNIEGGQVRISTGFQAGDDLVFVNQNGISGVYNTLNGVLTLTGTSSVANYQTALQSIKFQSTNPVPSSSKTVEFKVNDGDVDSNAATKGLAITSVNTAPFVTAGGTLAYTENDAATAVAPALTVVEPEGEPLQSGSASITSNFQSGEDALSWTDNDTLDTIIQAPSTNQTINLTGVGTDAQYQAALRAVKYANSSESPSNATRTVTFAATDAIGATGSDTRAISVTPVDDPPVATNDSATFTEDDPATAVPVLTNDTDVDGGLKEITNFSDPANGTVVGTGGSANHWTGLTYQPDANYCNNPPDTTPDTFTYTLNGGSQATVSVHVTCVNDAPVATDESFTGSNSAVGNTTFVGNDPTDGAPATPDPTDTSPVTDRPHKTISGDILANDTDVDSPSSGFTVTPGTFATNDGGTVTIQSDGDFTFEPKASTSCTDNSDFFDYTLNDNDSLGNQTDTGRVTIAITGCVWYVNNDDAQGNSGTSEKPFDTLAQAETASGTNHSIFVYDGNDTTTGYDAGFNLKSGQKLIGEAATLTVGSDTLHSADAANKPTITDNNADVVDLDDGTTVKGFNIDPQGTGGGITGTTGDTGGGTIDDVNIVDTGTAGTQPSLELDGTTGTFNISNLTVDNTGATSPPDTESGVRLNNAGTVNFVSTGTVSINTKNAAGVTATSTNMGTSTFDDITVASSDTGGVFLLNTTGTTTLGDGSGTDLNLTTTAGSQAALTVNSGGTVSVDSAGTDDLHATGGPAADIQATSGATFAFDDVDSTNSANDGINIDGLGTGTFSATSGDITGAAGISFDLNGGSGSITYPGNFGNGSGTTAIDITGRSGGSVSLSGSISDTNDAGGGVNVSSNTGGSTTLSAATKQFNTGASDAVDFTSSDGHTLTLSGGGTDIDTTTGKGVEATTSGTLAVSGSGNTIDTGTGRGLNISDTDIDAADVTFQHISSNGATNGIRLNNTGSAGNLAVTGTGTAGSGGTIQSSSDDGISVSSVGGGLSLTRMALTSNGNAAGDSGLDATELTGTVDLTSDNFTNNFDSGVRISNSSGTLNTNVTGAGSVYSGAGTSGGAGDGIFVEGTGTGAQNLNITGTSSDPIVFSGNKDSHVQSTSDSANTTDSDVTIDHTSMSEPDDNVATQLGGGITINHGGNANVDATITNNNIQNSIIGAIAVDTSGSVADQQQAFIDATIQNNTIGTTGDDGSGSSQGNGIFVSSNGAGHVRTNITGNTVRQWTNRNGLELDVDDGPAQLDATVKGNTFTEPNSAFGGTTTRGWTMQLGAAQAGDNIQACLDLGDASNASLKNQVFGNGESPQPDIRWLYEGPSTGGPSSVKLANYSGSADATITDIANYLQPRNNTGGTPTVSGTADPTGTGTTTSVASCPLPAP